MAEASLDFKATNHLAMARGLSDLLVDVIRDKPEFGDGVVADRLIRLRDLVWPETAEKALKVADRDSVFDTILEGLDAKQKSQFLEAYARMGHIYEIAGLAARSNYFLALKEQGAPVPGGVDEFVANEKDARTAVGKLNQPMFEVVMTMHPTNTCSLEFMQTQRALAIAIESGEIEKVKGALEAMERTPISPQANGQDVNFTVRDETRVVLNYLGNIYDDLPRIYEQYDGALGKKFGNEYDPTQLALKMRFTSWGSAGDKDGNNSVTAETTLEAIALHTQAIMERYLKDLGGIQSPQLAEWKTRLAEDKVTIDALVKEAGQLRGYTDRLRKGEEGLEKKDISAWFDGLSHKLASVRIGLKPKEFEDAAMAAYGSRLDPEQKQRALDLARRIRTFGFNFSKIEYRETAEEYERVVAEIVPGYKELSPQQRVEILTEALTSDSDRLVRAFEEAKQSIIRQGATKSYSRDDAMPIAYHTLKRMELARLHGDMIRDNVLAECGRLDRPNASDADVAAQGVANILEAQFLQRMTRKYGKQALLGIVPLFEEPSTMKNIDHILQAAYDNKAYHQHLEALAQNRYGERMTQQVQIAHSDNARRSGLQAARAFIHEAHKKVRVLNKSKNIVTQFFEGGSISDAYRNGVRSISASVNAFELHDFMKFTFQGGDLLNYFNLPASNERIFTRNMVHSAERFQEIGDGRWVVRRRISDSNPLTLESADDNRMRKYNVAVDQVAIEALTKTLGDYDTHDFKTNTMGVLLAVLDYDGETQAGNISSRAGKRDKGAGAFAKAESTGLGLMIQPVEVDNVRTIGFSEAWQHSGIVPSWIGSQKLQEHLQDAIRQKLAYISDALEPTTSEIVFDELFKDIKTGDLTAKHIQTLYEKSPAFRDAQDRAAFALAMGDPLAFSTLEQRLDSFQDDSQVTPARGYLQHIKATSRKAGNIAYAALRGKHLKSEQEGDVISAMRAALPNLRDDIARKTGYRSFLLHARKRGGLDLHDRRVVHNAGDTVVHGRFLTADDPAYGEDRLKQHTPKAPSL